MEDWQQRTQLLLGDEKMERLRRAHVLVVGLGGVGAYAAEMICRAGVGRMTIVDADTVQPTNINRQLPALHSTLGQKKAEILASRFRDINPALELRVLPVIKVKGCSPEDKVELFQIAETFKARVIDYGKDSLLLEFVQTATKNDAVIKLIKEEFKHIEVVRGGSVGIESISMMER